jgi:hypothetical protein
MCSRQLGLNDTLTLPRNLRHVLWSQARNKISKQHGPSAPDPTLDRIVAA